MITVSIPARTLTAFGLLALISGLAAAQVQQVYRYIDVDGRVVYSDKPPPPSARDAQAKRIGGNNIETSELSFSVQQAQERNLGDGHAGRNVTHAHHSAVVGTLGGHQYSRDFHASGSSRHNRATSFMG